MQIELVTKEEFTGVIYTRGSFYKQKAPCFMEGRGARSLTMKFPLGQCQTLQEGDVFSNVVVVQHDPELVTTGDAAFQVECDFRKPRSITVNADLQAKDARWVYLLRIHHKQSTNTQKTFSTKLRAAYGSRITLTSPDPSAVATHKRSKRDTVQSDTNEVTFVPHDADDVTNERKISDEL